VVKFIEEAGNMAMEDSNFMVKGIAGLFIPSMLAVILVSPAAAPVTMPSEEITTMVGSELAQVTLELMSAVEPSE
jgi:hypothetical protein